MDNRFTKKRVANMLSYDWIKMIFLVVAIVFLWVLAFTIGSPRASKGQTFGIFYFYGGDYRYSTDPTTLGENMQKEGVFSYDVLDFNVREIGETYAEILLTSNSVQEGDVMITVDHPESIEKLKSPFRILIDNYGEVFYDYNDLIADAKKYCLENGFVYSSNGVYYLNEQRITDYFTQRMKKDPRFRNEESQRYQDGVKGEIERIKRVWNNAIMLEDCLNTHPEIKYSYVRYTQTVAADPNAIDAETLANQKERVYGINLGRLTGTEKVITSDFYYNLYDEEGAVTGSTAEGIVLCVYDYYGYQPHLQFETLSFVNAMISKYSNFLNTQLPALIK